MWWHLGKQITQRVAFQQLDGYITNHRRRLHSYPQGGSPDTVMATRALGKRVREETQEDTLEGVSNHRLKPITNSRPSTS